MTRAPRPSLWPYALAVAIGALFLVVLTGAW